MIYSLNEARNAEEYRAEKAAREKAENKRKNKQYDDRYRGKNKDVLGLFTQKTRADGHKDVYYTAAVGSHNRKCNKSENKTYHIPDYGDAARYDAAEEVADRNNDKSGTNLFKFRDAVNRNMRRHPERWDGDKPVKPKSESTIFDNIEII